MKKILLFLSLTIVNITITATNYYASPNGNGNGLSYQTPASLSTALTMFRTGGDTLYLLGGQYDLPNTSIQNTNGTAAKRKVISGFPGEKAILDFRQTPYGTRGLQIKNTCTYLHIKDMTLRYSGKNNLYNEGSYNLFEHLDIYGSADTGCQMKNGGNNIIKNVDSHDNFDYQTMSGTTANFGGNADGFADKQFTGNGNHYIGCRAWNNSDDGWDFFQRVSSSQTIIENCVCFQNGAPYYDMSQHGRYLTDKSWFDQKVGTQMVDRYGNTITITLQQYPNQGNGNGFKMGGGYTNHQILIHHSLAVGNYERGFDQNNNDGTMYVYNCSGYLNSYNFGFTTAYGTNYMRNNISLSGRNADQPKSKTIAANEHNTWNSGYGCTAADFQSLDTTEILAPRQADGELAAGVFMRLADGSSLINAGVDVGLDYTGIAPDLGCYETDGYIRPSITCTSLNSEQWLILGDSIEAIVFQWGGSATRLTCSNKPEGITHKISNNNKTLTLSGIPGIAGDYVITVTTQSEDDVNPSLSAILHVLPADAKRIAYVTTPGAGEDAAILNHLRQSNTWCIYTTDATNNNIDYSHFDVIVLGSKPNSGAAGYASLKGYSKPMLVLKPFLFKNTVWNWGTAINTSDLAIHIAHPEHIIFRGIQLGADNTLTLFKKCTTNAVTAISTWTGISTEIIASPTSNLSYTTIADFAPGSNLNGTTLTERLLMIGISEYSTVDISEDGLSLLSNAILYLLEEEIVTDTEDIHTEEISQKELINGHIIIRRGGNIYNVMGQKINNTL